MNKSNAPERTALYALRPFGEYTVAVEKMAPGIVRGEIHGINFIPYRKDGTLSNHKYLADKYEYFATADEAYARSKELAYNAVGRMQAKVDAFFAKYPAYSDYERSR